ILGLSGLLALGALAALLYWPPRFETDLRNIHAANSPTLHVQETIAALFGGSQEPLLLLVEDATESQVMQGLHRLQPTLTAMVQEGLLAAVTSPAMLYPDAATQTAVLQRLQAKDPPQLRTALTAALTAHGIRGTLSGLYTISSASAALLSADFIRITGLAFLSIVLLVILYMRRLWLISMVLLPVGCGTLWTAGFFALCGFKLNFM